MLTFTNAFASTAAVAAAVVGIAASMSSDRPVTPAPLLKTTTAAAAVTALMPKAAPAIGIKSPTAKFSAAEDAVRSQLRFETVRWAGKPVQTLDEQSRILLVRAAAEKAGLGDVGLSYRDVYGVIEAETSWIPRMGASKNGTPNLGIAQFEPATAKAYGLTDPNDPVQAVFTAAIYMKEGAQWASKKLSHLKLTPEQHAAKVREGVSVYYNLSVKGRNKWDGANTATLPIETQRHIRNAVAGAMEAAELARGINI